MSNNELDFEQVYAEFQPRIYRYLVRLVGPREAEDVTQDVFIKVAKGLQTFENRSQFSTWIYKVATNAAIDRMRSRSADPKPVEIYKLSEVDLNASIERSGKRQRSIEEQVARKEMNKCIQECIKVLPEQHQMILVLSELKGFKNSEIAVILGLSIDAVKIRLHRAKEKLRTLLVEHCSFYRTECCGRLVCEPKRPITEIRAKYIREQDKHDQMMDKITTKELENPFRDPVR